MKRFSVLLYRLVIVAAIFGAVSALLAVISIDSRLSLMTNWTRVMWLFWPGFVVPSALITFWTLRTSAVIELARDQSLDILAEAERFGVNNPGWDRAGLVAAARCAFDDGATTERVAILYGPEIAAEACK